MPLQEELEYQGNVLFKRRGTLPVIILLIGFAVFAYYHWQGQTMKDEFNEMIYEFICLGVCFVGLFIRAFAIGFAAPNTSGRNVGGQIADHLNTKGIYSLMRHPLYVGNFFMWLGPSMLTQNLWFNIAFIFIYWVYYERIMFAEEQYLRKKFGEMYVNWASNVPAFVPRFKKYQKNELSFGWKKVLKQEKNGFLAIFVVFFLFDLIQSLIDSGKVFFIDNYWFYAFVGSGLVYLIIKLLKKYTSVLVGR